MKITFSEASAAIVRPELDDCVYYFGEPDFVLKGNWDQWDKLECALDDCRTGSREGVHPDGAAVGYFSYEGDFEFHFHRHFHVGTSDSLWPKPGYPSSTPAVQWEEDCNRQAYESMVRRSHDYIRSGDIYQVNLARRLHMRVPDFDDKEFFRHLWLLSGAPRAAYLGFDDRKVMSASPELFLSIDGRRIMTQPIKGTRPRDADPTRDKLNSLELSTDPKELAELIMITDLERNDLGMICEFGTVSVSELVKQRSFSHVHHQYSTVEGELREGISPLQAVRACFPGGSITGAPKKRSMEIIRELEPLPRGLFTGAIGYFGYDGSVRLNIAIRTAIYEKGLLHFHVGSGITIYSDPTKEFEETSHKASVIEQAYSIYKATKLAETR